MYITHHVNVTMSGNVVSFPHNCLDKEIREFILEKEATQKEYMVRSNGYYLFIYLSNGDRVDVLLK